MNRKLQAVLAMCGIAMATHAAAQITLYEGEGFHGRAITTNDRIWNFDRAGFNDRASSVVVDRGRWEVCEHARFEGRCVILSRGSYPSLRQIGMNNAISSVRPIDGGRHRGDGPPPVVVVPQYEPPRPLPQPMVVVPPPPAYYEVPVTSARAVAAAPTQRCWTEREQVAQPSRGEANVPGAVVGGIVGGVLGHQIGGGTGKDVATIGGAVAGAAIGANVNRGAGTSYVERDVQRCEPVANAQPAYWEVTYLHRGVERRVQLPSAPGPTLRINAEGVPLPLVR